MADPPERRRERHSVFLRVMLLIGLFVGTFLLLTTARWLFFPG